MMIAEECKDCEYNNRDYGCLNHDCEIYQIYQQELEYEQKTDVLKEYYERLQETI